MKPRPRTRRCRQPNEPPALGRPPVLSQPPAPNGRAPKRSGRRRRGFSLLEMILALGILGMSLAVLGGIADTGTDAAREARALVAARVIAQTKLNEELLNITNGISPTTVVNSPAEPFDSLATETFTYSLEVANGQLDGLLAIRITVQALGGDGTEILANVVIDRWVIDPALGLEEAEAEEAAAREEIASGGEEAI